MKILFERTEACKKIIAFLHHVNKNVKIEKQMHNSKVLSLINGIRKISCDTKLSTEPQRYGNVAFATFYDNLERRIKDLIDENKLTTKNTRSSNYLLASFGNPTRIDYGTGHELNFFCYLFCLVKDELLCVNECAKALCDYLELSSEIIIKYNLEPAGSHGVWGLDDYHFLSYVFGSAELFDCEDPFESLFEEKNKNLMFAKALIFCHTQKTRNRYSSFKIHSPMLYDLKNKTWMHINTELINQYEKDVIKSTAVNQHFIDTIYLPLMLDKRFIDK